jgi:hypothetical protein
VWRASTGVIHFVTDQISNLQYKIALPPPQTKTYEGRAPQTGKQKTSATKSLYRSIFKKRQFLWVYLYSYLVHDLTDQQGHLRYGNDIICPPGVEDMKGLTVLNSRGSKELVAI